MLCSICNPVATVGPRGEWESLQIGTGGYCPPGENCKNVWMGTADGQIEFTKQGEAGSATMSDYDLSILQKAIDGPQLRVALLDGIECSGIPEDIGARMTLVLDGQTLVRTVSGCVYVGPDGNVLQRIYDIVTAY